MADGDVELMAIEDLQLCNGEQSTVVLAGQRVRLSLRQAQCILSKAPDAAVLVPTVRPGTSIFWHVAGVGRCGPAQVCDSFVDSTSGHTWLGVEWQGATQLIRGDQVTVAGRSC